MPYIVITAANTTAQLQNALTTCATAGGGTVDVQDGTFAVTTPLKIGDNTHLKLGGSVKIVREIIGGGAVNATIQNTNLSSGTNSNIRLTGGTLDLNGQLIPTGKQLAFRNVTGLWVTGVRMVSVWNDWFTSFVDCSDVIISNIVIRGGSGSNTDGLHFAGCRRVSVSDSVIECGDDALSLTNETSSAPVNPLEDFVASNLYLYSRGANPVRISIIKTAGTWTPVPIRRVRLSNIVAKSGAPNISTVGRLTINGLAPPEPGGSDLVTDIEVDGFTLSFEPGKAGSPLDIDYAKRIRISRFVALQPGARAEIDGATDVELNDCVIDSPTISGAQCLLIAASESPASCENIRIVGGQYRNATHHAMILGTAPSVDPPVTAKPVTGFEISGALIEGQTDTVNPTKNTLNGVLLSNANGGIVRGNNILGCNFKGIEEASPSTNNLFIANRVKDNLLGGLALTGATSDAARNYPSSPGLEADDTGGFRQTIDGWVKLQIPVNFGPTEMTRVIGRFRAARSGSVTGIALGLTKARAVGFGGVMTATVYKNTGIAGAAGVTTGLSVVINTDGTTKIANTQDQDKNAASQFFAGDELYIVIQTANWVTNDAMSDVYASLEIED